MKIEKDFRELLELLNGKKAKYLIVGGFAFSLYAEPRYTKDIDLFIDRSRENALKVHAAMGEFWKQALSLAIEDLMIPDTIVQFGDPPLRIDVITSIEGIEFDTAWERRVNSNYGDITAWFISLEDLIVNKKASGRDQDLLDAKMLEKIKERKARKSFPYIESKEVV